MNYLWKLVLLAVISAGVSIGNDIEDNFDLNSEENRHSSFLLSSDPLTSARFQCHNKPSGYYADPRFDCKVFHFCHEDGTRSTIPCDHESEKHNICIFKDITFNACEGSEIYLALPQDLDVKPTKDTTAINSATDFWLPKVLPMPSDANQSTTPLSFESKKSPGSSVSKEVESIFEVYNTVLREIQAEERKRTLKDTSNLKVKPSVFSRGSSKFQASSIRRDDSEDSSENFKISADRAAYLVEVNKRKNEKLLDDFSSKKPKGFFFLPKSTRSVPGDHPRRKKRTAVSRLHAVIYRKVPDASPVTNHRKDVIEVPFVAARVPSDVPTVPITIETRRRKKSKSKKNKIIPQTFYVAEEADREQTSEQQNVLYFMPEQVPAFGLQDPGGRSVVENRHRPRQSSRPSQAQIEKTPSPQSNSQPTHQTPQSSQNRNPFPIPNFPFQPTTFLSNQSPPQYYYGNPNGQFSPYGLPDQFAFQPQHPQAEQPQSFQQPPNREAEIKAHRQRQQNSARQSRLPANDNIEVRQPPNVHAQNIRQPENLPSQTQPRSPVENVPKQATRRPPQAPRQQVTSTPYVRQRDNVRPQTYQPETRQPPAFRQHQKFRQPETVEPHSIQQPLLIQPQPIRQLQDIQLGNIPGLPFAPPVNSVDTTIRRPPPANVAHSPGLHMQNSPPADQNVRERPQRPHDVAPGQTFPGFDNPFFHNFPSFEAFPFNEPFAQPGPPSYDLLPPPGSPYAGHQIPPQDLDNQERPPEHLPQQLGAPRDHQMPQGQERPREPSFSRPGRPRDPQQLGRPIDLPPPQQMAEQMPGNQPEEGMVYIPQHDRNPNLIGAEKAKPGRSKLRENIEDQTLVTVPQPSRPSRNRGRPSSHSESNIRGSENHRTRGQSQRQNYREPHSNRVQERPYLEPQIHHFRRPSDHQYLTPPTEIPNEQRHRLPSSTTVEVPNFRLQHTTKPQNVRDDHRERNNQRQPTRQRTRENHNVNNNEQAGPQYETYRYIPTTPLPQQRERPSTQSLRESYGRDPRPQNEELIQDKRLFRTSPPPRERTRTSVTPKRRPVTSPPQYERTRTPENVRIRTSSEPQSHGFPVTSRYHVTSPPRFRPADEDRRQHLRPEEAPVSLYERPRVRSQAQVERPPPPEYVNAEALPEEQPRPQRYSHNFQHDPSVGNDLNAVSKYHEDRSREPENIRTRHRGTSYNRENHTPEIENGFLPVSDTPSRNQYHSTRSPENEQREPEYERPRNRHQSQRENIPTTRATTTPKPTKKRKPPPPRPTFPAFPTFPPPPRRVITTPRPTTTEESPEEEFRPHVTEEEIRTTPHEPIQRIQTTPREPIQRNRFREDFRTEVSVSRHIASDLPTDAPEVTTKRRTRKRKPKRPRTTTFAYDADEDAEGVETITQATTRREFTTRSTPRTTRTTTVRPSPSTTRSTPSNYNRWRQQTPAQRKSTTTEAADVELATEPPKKSEEYGSRLNLFGRPRTRKPTSFAPKTTTPTSFDQERRTPTATRTRRPYVKKVRKKVTTESPDTTDPIARSDEDEDTLQFVSDFNSLHGLDSITQLSVQDLDENSQVRATEPYNDGLETTTIWSKQEEGATLQPEDGDFESTRAVSKKFENRPRILKFGKPRLRATDSSTLNISVGGSKA